MGGRPAACGLACPSASHNALVFTPDGAWLVLAGSDGFLRVHSASTGRGRLALDLPGGIHCALAISPGGRSVASGGMDRTMQLRDLSRALEPESGD